MTDFFAKPVKIKKLSIICPVYNEISTAKLVINNLLEIQNNYEDYELIIVESNSTDGTRNVVKEFEKNRLVKVLYEQGPLGKGSAVKIGLKNCTGDVVVIFDADNEYEVNDLQRLTNMLENGETSFCLGTRHKDGMKMRNFVNNNFLSRVFNGGHVVFTIFFNYLFNVNLTDPFTMYKVFRFEILNGINLKSNRFDIDWEILGKAIRVGAIPIEVPISYKSRSFNQGKKVKMFRDPINWIYRAFIIRFGPL